MSDPAGRQQPPSRIKTPNSLRIAQIAVGVITLVLAGLIIAFPGFAIFLIAIYLSVSLLFGGIESIIIGVGATFLSKRGRVVGIGVGVAAMALSVAALAFPGAAVLTLVLLLSVALLFLGAGAIARGISEKRMPRWARAMFVTVGVITVGLSIPVMILPTFGMSLLFGFVAAALIINGASYIIAGITRAIFQPVTLGLGRRARRPWESDAA